MTRSIINYIGGAFIGIGGVALIWRYLVIIAYLMVQVGEYFGVQ